MLFKLSKTFYIFKVLYLNTAFRQPDTGLASTATKLFVIRVKRATDYVRVIMFYQLNKVLFFSRNGCFNYNTIRYETVVTVPVKARTIVITIITLISTITMLLFF